MKNEQSRLQVDYAEFETYVDSRNEYEDEIFYARDNNDLTNDMLMIIKKKSDYEIMINAKMYSQFLSKRRIPIGDRELSYLEMDLMVQVLLDAKVDEESASFCMWLFLQNYRYGKFDKVNESIVEDIYHSFTLMMIDRARDFVSIDQILKEELKIKILKVENKDNLIVEQKVMEVQRIDQVAEFVLENNSSQTQELVEVLYLNKLSAFCFDSKSFKYQGIDNKLQDFLMVTDCGEYNYNLQILYPYLDYGQKILLRAVTKYGVRLFGEFLRSQEQIVSKSYIFDTKSGSRIKIAEEFVIALDDEQRVRTAIQTVIDNIIPNTEALIQLQSIRQVKQINLITQLNLLLEILENDSNTKKRVLEMQPYFIANFNIALSLLKRYGKKHYLLKFFKGSSVRASNIIGSRKHAKEFKVAENDRFDLYNFFLQDRIKYGSKDIVLGCKENQFKRLLLNSNNYFISSRRKVKYKVDNKISLIRARYNVRVR